MNGITRNNRIAELNRLQRFALEHRSKDTDPSVLAKKLGGHLIPIAYKAAEYIQPETFEQPDWKGRPAMGAILANTIGQSIYADEAERPYYHERAETGLYLHRNFILPSSEGVATLRMTVMDEPPGELPLDVQYRVGVYQATSLGLPKPDHTDYTDYDYSLPDTDQNIPDPQELQGRHIASYWLTPWHQNNPEYLLAYDEVGEEAGNQDSQRKALTHAALILVNGFRHAIEIS